MLTELEMKILDRVYSLCCKLFTFPFTWENGKLSMKLIQNSIWNSLVQLLVLSTSILKLIYLLAPVHDSKNDINGLILHGIFFICAVANAIYKLNFWFYGLEMVQLVNEFLLINSVWGDQNVQHPKLNYI